MSEERFEIIREIGRGSRSVVYRARDRLLNRDVALKVYQRGSSTAPLHQHFLGEARAMASVDHPHVVGLWGIEEREDELRIALALIDGTLLTASRRPLSMRQIASIGRDLCSALGSLHARGVLHRDIRPENVMLRPNGSAVLLDFGVERSVHCPEAATNLDEFDAPELRSGAPFSPATDVYALARLMQWLGADRLRDPLASVVSRATASDPSVRTRDPEALSIELALCIGEPAPRPYAHVLLGLAAVAAVSLGLLQWSDTAEPASNIRDGTNEEDAPASPEWLIRGEGQRIMFDEFVAAMPWRATFEGRVPAALPSDAETVRVPEDHATVSEAYLACGDGGFVVIGPGEHVVSPMSAKLAKTVTLFGSSGAARTSIVSRTPDGQPAPVLAAEAEGCVVIVKGITISDGTGFAVPNQELGRFVKVGGGVLATRKSRIVLEDCIVCCNGLTGSAYGSAFYASSGAEIEIRDSLVVANYATLNSCIACIDGASLIAERCTFARNAASGDNVTMGGLSVLGKGSIRLDQCIVWDNAAWAGIGRDFTPSSNQASGFGKIVIERSITFEPYTGPGNRSIDPKFRDPDRGDFRLQPGVPWSHAGCFRD